MILKVKMLQKNDSKLSFLVEGTNPAFANALRRVMVSEIPVLAVGWVDMENNTSALFDELISHRLGLMPLKFDPAKFTFTEDCKCKGKGCSLCQAVLVADKKGPCLVKSGDLKSSVAGVSPIDPNIPIVELLEGQALKLQAFARLGTGKMHARCQAANVGYHYYPEIGFKGSAAEAARIAGQCPPGLVSAKGAKLVVNDVVRGDVARGCLQRFDDVDVKGDESRIVFNMESVSGLKPEYVVSRAAEIIGERAAELRSHVSKI